MYSAAPSVSFLMSSSRPPDVASVPVHGEAHPKDGRHLQWPSLPGRHRPSAPLSSRPFQSEIQQGFQERNKSDYGII